MTSDVTLELSKEINVKLQQVALYLCSITSQAHIVFQVLEDYVVQNIQLKAGIETLGNEIARLNERSLRDNSNSA